MYIRKLTLPRLPLAMSFLGLSVLPSAFPIPNSHRVPIIMLILQTQILRRFPDRRSRKAAKKIREMMFGRYTKEQLGAAALGKN